MILHSADIVLATRLSRHPFFTSFLRRKLFPPFFLLPSNNAPFLPYYALTTKLRGETHLTNEHTLNWHLELVCICFRIISFFLNYKALKGTLLSLSDRFFLPQSLQETSRNVHFCAPQSNTFYVASF